MYFNYISIWLKCWVLNLMFLTFSQIKIVKIWNFFFFFKESKDARRTAKKEAPGIWFLTKKMIAWLKTASTMWDLGVYWRPTTFREWFEHKIKLIYSHFSSCALARQACLRSDWTPEFVLWLLLIRELPGKKCRQPLWL